MTCIGQVEIDPFCRKVLAKHWPDVPKFEDVKGFTRASIDETPDLICGGFPCQDISNAGKRAGIDGERSGLWSEFYRIICEFRPRFVLVENVAALLVPCRYGEPAPIARVLGNLASIGYDAEWTGIRADSLGVPQARPRIFIVADSARVGSRTIFHQNTFDVTGNPARLHASCGVTPDIDYKDNRTRSVPFLDDGTWAEIPDGERIGNDSGIPYRMDRLKSLGNSVVPQVAEFIGRAILSSSPSPCQRGRSG